MQAEPYQIRARDLEREQVTFNRVRHLNRRVHNEPVLATLYDGCLPEFCLSYNAANSGVPAPTEPAGFGRSGRHSGLLILALVWCRPVRVPTQQQISYVFHGERY